MTNCYARMDHAGWVEGNELGRKGAPESLSAFQSKVMDILGMVSGGIYNAPIAWSKVNWRCGAGVSVPWRYDLSTFDYHHLTLLVFLCHKARIRCCISPYTFKHLLLTFHPRAAKGSVGKRHPNLEEAVAAFEEYLPADHRIVHRGGEER